MLSIQVTALPSRELPFVEVENPAWLDEDLAKHDLSDSLWHQVPAQQEEDLMLDWPWLRQLRSIQEAPLPITESDM